EKEKMDYDPLVDSGNKGKQFNIESENSVAEEFKNVPFNIRVSDPKAETYKDMKLQDKVGDYFDKNPIVESIS
ncbi:17845_t:CDS:2, partial [Acaulospora morrowiae]